MAESPAARLTEEHIRARLRSEKWRLAKQKKLLYLLFLIPAASLFIFHYIPIYGVLIAFKDYRYHLGLVRSPWNNFEHFRFLLGTPYFIRIFRNTLVISSLRILFGFPAPILLAILINEIQNTTFKRAVQSISYLPHFMSWVVLSGIVIEILSPQRGIVGLIYSKLGQDAPNLLASSRFFRPMLVTTGIWQSIGWGSIIYLASITTINPELYESAAIDGANRFRMAVHITIPSLVPVITILFILRLGVILNAGFEQIFNLYSPLVYEVADVIDTYVYRVGLIEGRYDFTTAVGLFKNVIGVLLLLVTNGVVRRFSEYGVW